MIARYARNLLTGVSSLLWLFVLSSSSVLIADDDFNTRDWPFRPLAQPTIPNTENSSWSRTPIDHFVLQKLGANQLQPSPEASKLTLLRRATFDLWGLPPTSEQQSAFLTDDSADAFERLVDQLLSAPQYGERWAQFWLDVVRFTESDGFKSDSPRTTAFRYRDYVIRALNDDLPYDRFIQQQLAGDEMEPGNSDALIATNFLRLYPEDAVASDMRQSWQDILNDVTDVTSLAFMGLTVGCARCHDHKFDPIKQTDFYRLQATFAPMLPQERMIASNLEATKFERRTREWEQATHAIRTEMDELVKQHRADVHAEVVATYDAETQDAINTPIAQQTTLQKQLCHLCSRYLNRRYSRAYLRLETSQRARWDELDKQLKEFDRLKPEPLPTIPAVSDSSSTTPTTFVLATGLLRAPTKGQVQPGTPEFLGGAGNVNLVNSSAAKSPRRTELAKWLTQPNHPLTARVIVNRIWQQHIGSGIVGTPNDFGAMGQSATHPELLDWLASELVAKNWQLKHVHRLILTSATYRQSAQVDDENNPIHAKALESDEDNKLLWRANRRRLQGESVRDAMLFVAGSANNRMFGPSAMPDLPKALMASRYAWEPDPVLADRNRRSIYVFVRRNLRYPILAAFDAPDGFNSCAERPETVTVPQSLALFNSSFALEQSREWAGDLLKAHGCNFRTLVAHAYSEAYGRKALNDELDAGEKFISQQGQVIDKDVEVVPDASLPEPKCNMVTPEQSAAVVDFCHALLNSTEFMYVE